ncbi:MAG: MutH/Sau3AI family endonuclease [Polyangiaceae bacterium]
MSTTLEIDELVARARSLEGLAIDDVARELRADGARLGGVHGKGRLGELVELALGASGGSGRRVVDFPALGVELKTIPVDRRGKPKESTFVAAIDLGAELDWEDSWVKKKLERVLFVPIVDEDHVFSPPGEKVGPCKNRTFGRALLWSPTPAQEAGLRGDYDDVMGLAFVGRIEDVTAHLGRWLQVRPKARDGRARTLVLGREGERIATVPRGFYLRARFTGALLEDPAATPP